MDHLTFGLLLVILSTPSVFNYNLFDLYILNVTTLLFKHKVILLKKIVNKETITAKQGPSHE